MTNIVYIHSHDTGRFLQPYGCGIPTPNIQRLAEGGVTFLNAFCAGPTCSPSRASLLTGMWPHCNGMTGLAHRGFALNDYSRHIVATLRSAGYETALAGVQHEAADQEQIGYEKYLSARKDEHNSDLTTSAACSFIKAGRSRPFFLSVGYYETHRSFPVNGPQVDRKSVTIPRGLPDTPETREDMACFVSSAMILDANVGKVLDAVDQAGLAGDTLIISTTDHGIPFPGMKCNLVDRGIGVSLIMRGPGGFSGGKSVSGMVSHLDVFPTICEVAGIPAPGWLQGRSMVPLATGKAAEIRDELFAEVTYHAAYEPMRCVRTRNCKYIRRYGNIVSPIMNNMDNGLSKDAVRKLGWQKTRLEEEQLFDLALDPFEEKNVAGDAAYSSLLNEMRARLARFMESTDDPLRKGYVDAPPGAKVDPPQYT